MQHMWVRRVMHAYKVLNRKQERKRTFGRPRCRLRLILKLLLKK
jgi:hypothetical protein